MRIQLIIEDRFTYSWFDRIQRPADDFGNAIRFAPFVTKEEREDKTNKLYGIVERWEVSTSTYGGDSFTDCCEV